MNPKICLLSITASHYRELIYLLIDRAFDCDFVFGMDSTTVKRLDTSILKNSTDIKNVFIGSSSWYIQPGLIKKTKEYDVLINDLGIYCFSSWLVMILAKFRKQRVYNWDHGWYGRENFLKKWIKRAYFGLSTGSFIYGNYAKDLMIKNGFDAKKLHVIHNSLNYDKQLEIRKRIQKSSIYKEHFRNDLPVLIFIGRLTKVKKLHQLVEMLKLLNNRGEQFNLVLVGDGTEQKTLQSLVCEKGLTNQVWFYGACYDEQENAELIYNADLCVAPGNVGLTAMHAMMFGCPVLTHNDLKWQMPEFEAIKDLKTGTFFANDNVESLAMSVSNWFDLKQQSRDEVRESCFKEIDEEWNPHNQLRIIKEVIYG